MTAVIIGSGAICAVGIGIMQIAASVRAGLSRFAASPIQDRNFDPITMALLPEPALGELVPELAGLPLGARLTRLLRLAAPALQQAARRAPDLSRTPVLVGLPEARALSQAESLLPAAASPTAESFLSLLAAQSQLRFAHFHSQVFPLGRAAALIALERALELLSTGQCETVIVGGVDTHVDLRLLAGLSDEQRLLGGAVTDGFIPGEGAAFVVLSAAADRSRAATRVIATAGALDPGHRYGSAPARGEGLAHAVAALRSRLPASAAPVGCTWAGLNGENFGAKEWGVAQLRHRELFSESMQLEHPADCYGDLGAATGAMLLALAEHTMSANTRPSPALIWASSDREPVACAYLSDNSP